MVAEPWLLRMGNQVSGSIKNSLFLHQNTSSKKKDLCTKIVKQKQKQTQKQTIGILSFEVANVMSRLVHLHKSVSDEEISKLKSEIIKSEGVKKLVSTDETYLLELAFSERIDDLNRIAEVVSRLGKKCTEPALLGFEHVYGDITTGKIEVKELGFLVKDMDSMIRKMERFVGSTANLYAELEVLNELEQATKKFHLNHNDESCRAFEQKLSWQRQDVSHLRDLSLWNQTYDKVVELLARTVCTLFVRICVAFGNIDVVFKPNCATTSINRRTVGGGSSSSITCVNTSGKLENLRQMDRFNSLPNDKKKTPNLRTQLSLQKPELDLFQRQDLVYPCAPSPGRIFMECLSLGNSASRIDDNKDDCCSSDENNHEYPIHSDSLYRSQVGLHCNWDRRQLLSSVNASRFGPRSRLATHATLSTVGGSALALHYANVIIVIEKLLRYPHLVGEEARDDLYQMLPSSLRKSLRMNLKSNFKNFAIFDGALAHDWKETLDQILKWLAPLAHNMIRWQSERNFEQQQIVTRTNALLLQTLYFADREKTESAICNLLVGLNYICRYEHQQNALLDCASSFDFGDWMEWQLQCQASCFD
ncbi:Processive diacylglycerol beta-glucosyltransferase [Bienertia sinuspersici]